MEISHSLSVLFFVFSLIFCVSDRISFIFAVRYIYVYMLLCLALALAFQIKSTNVSCVYLKREDSESRMQ